MGKRGWKMFYVVLKDMILYLYKDEQGMKKAGSSGDGSHNAIRVHHCLASKAMDYSKKQHVLRLQTACWAEFLFQTSNTKELKEWIDTLNYVAASLSSPPLPGAVGSNKRFQRPLLPVSYILLNMQDQLRHWEERLVETEKDLQEHRTYPPEKGSKASVIQHFLEKENYPVFEVDRLRTYIYLLQAKLSSQPELEPSLVETSIGEDEEGFSGPGSHDNGTATGGRKWAWPRVASQIGVAEWTIFRHKHIIALVTSVLTKVDKTVLLVYYEQISYCKSVRNASTACRLSPIYD